MSTLNGKQKRYLRSLGNGVKATVFIGQHGVSDSVVQATNEALASAELVKVRIQDGYLDDRKNAGTELAHRTNAEVVQYLGKTILLYKEDEENPSLELPQ